MDAASLSQPTCAGLSLTSWRQNATAVAERAACVHAPQTTVFTGRYSASSVVLPRPTLVCCRPVRSHFVLFAS